MNPKEASEMIKLDAWIAEHVMGIAMENVSWYCPKCRSIVHPTKVSPEKTHDARAFGCGSELHFDIPHYTTDPAAALEVLKKCVEYAKEKFGCSIILTDTMNGYCIGVTGLNPINPSCANTWEHSICLFAHQLFSKSKG